MRMRIWLVLLAALPLLAVGSGATAGTTSPPRNGLIAASGGDGIYLIDAQSTKAWKLPGTAELGEPAWSPDGSLLAVAGWDDSGNNVYTIRPDGSDRQLVLRDAWSPSWSPDGTRLAAVHGSTSSLVTVRADGSDLQSFTFATGNDSDVSEPVWSPDGKWIAFVDGEGAVMLVSPNGEGDGIRRLRTAGGTSRGLRMRQSLPSRRPTGRTTARRSSSSTSPPGSGRPCPRAKPAISGSPGLRTESSSRSSRPGRCRRAPSAVAAARCRWISG